MTIDEVYDWLLKMENQSIYEEKRIAQPDEVVNYLVADGIEKAFLLANVIRHRNQQQDIQIIIDDSRVTLRAQIEYRFVSSKNLSTQIDIPKGE
jgi:hypothetical protein